MIYRIRFLILFTYYLYIIGECTHGDVNLIGGSNYTEGRVDVLMDTGEQFVMIPGLIKMLRLCVNNSDIHMKVRKNLKNIYNLFIYDCFIFIKSSK